MSHRTIIFAKDLMTLRTLHEMTQQELADKIHVTRQTISTWELGAGKPDIYCLGGLCDLFDIRSFIVIWDNQGYFLIDKIEMNFREDVVWLKNL